MKKSRAVTVITLLSLIAAGAVAFGAVTWRKLARDERYIAANYSHAFTEFVTGVSDMDSALQKSRLITTPSMAGAVCTEVFGKAQTAKMAMGVLPFAPSELEKTSAFIGRVGDYAYALSRKAARGESFSQEEKDNLRSLSETSGLLAQNLQAMQSETSGGYVSGEKYAQVIESLNGGGERTLENTLGASMSKVEQEFPETPTLIYDGPFSEHPDGRKPLMLEGMNEVDVSAARKAAAQFLGIRQEQAYRTGEMAGDIPQYCFEAKINGEIFSVSVTKQGGVVDQLIGSRAVEQSKLSAKEAADTAKAYLERKGYTGMHMSYYMTDSNVLTANFAYEEGGVLCYPDLIKVSVAMDSGSIENMDAVGYIKSHHKRVIPDAVLSAEEAQSRVPGDLKVSNIQKTIIPSAGENEVLCYEFECEDENSQRYLIYVNAQSGEQEKLFILLQDENGTLTL